MVILNDQNGFYYCYHRFCFLLPLLLPLLRPLLLSLFPRLVLLRAPPTMGVATFVEVVEAGFATGFIVFVKVCVTYKLGRRVFLLIDGSVTWGTL
jgi:hypothetical protein